MLLTQVRVGVVHGSGPGFKLTIELEGNDIDRGKLDVTYKKYLDGSSEEEFVLSYGAVVRCCCSLTNDKE